MASIKISELNEYTEVQDDDLFVVVDINNEETKKVKATNIGTGGKELIMVGNESDATKNTKLLIETDTLDSLGTEVVNSLNGNETNKAPSVKVVNKALGIVGWTNPNPTSEFSAQTITLSTSDYNEYEVEFLLINSGNMTKSTGRITKEKRAYMDYIGGSGDLIGFMRDLTPNNDGTIAFNNAFRINTGVTENSRCIPLRIILYKKEVVSNEI